MPQIQFINHASVCISDKTISLLSDPWYQGTAFHDGWSLLYENKEDDIVRLLDTVSHIWISHEHPDHFSIAFFKKYAPQIKQRKIKFLFQQTKDKRVVKFLNLMNIEVQKLLIKP